MQRQYLCARTEAFKMAHQTCIKTLKACAETVEMFLSSNALSKVAVYTSRKYLKSLFNVKASVVLVPRV